MTPTIFLVFLLLVILGLSVSLIIVIRKRTTEKAMATASLKAIEKTNAQLKISQEIANLGYWELDLLGENHYWSEQMYSIFGIETRGPVMDRFSYLQHIHPDDIEIFRKTIQLAIQQKSTVKVEFRFIRNSGEIRECYATGKVLTDEQGVPFRIEGITQDITELKRIQNQTLKEKNLLNSIINSLPGTFYFYTKEGKFLRWNNNFEKVTGYTPDEISTMHPLDFFRSEEKEYMKFCIDDVFLKGSGDAEANFYTKNNQVLPYYFTGSFIEYDGEMCLLGVGIDISEKKEAQEKLQETSEQLRLLAAHQEEVREEERASMAREIHDELGQQLTGIKMDIYWLKEELGNKDPVIAQQLNNMLSMADGTINIVRRISASLRPLLLDDLGLVEAIRWHISEYEKRFNLKVKFDCNVKEIKMPPKIAIGLFRIIQESLTNIARHAESTNAWCELILNKGSIAINISDNGKGFNVQQANKKKTLGLLGMKERIGIMEGTLKIISSEGNGTEIFVTVPLASDL